MKIPNLPVPSLSRKTLEVFGGYNHNLRIGDGEFYEMENMTSDCYPVLSPRKRRGVVMSGENLTGAAFVETYGIVCADGENLRSLQGMTLPLALDQRPKQFVPMGSYVIIWPDMKYFNTRNPNDYGSLGHGVTVQTGEVTLRLCDAEGNPYADPALSDTPPQSPEDQSLWIDTSAQPHVLKRYSQASGSWVELVSTYVAISGLVGESDGGWFSRYDGVQISGLSGEAAHLNGTAVICAPPTAGTILIPGLLDKTLTQTCTPQAPVRVERRVPELDWIVEAGNRLWGCRYDKDINEIYCSKLGDFKNWECYMGLATDSWRASVGSYGPFTGAANIGGCPVFYKEAMRHKVWPSDTGAHQITSAPCQGVQSGCAHSVALLGGAAIYKSRRGFCLDDGSMPRSLGREFAGAVYDHAIGWAWGDKYYVSMVGQDNRRHLFVYDSGRDLWHREDSLNVTGFCQYSTFPCALDADTQRLLDLTGDVDRGAQNMEPPVSWMVETGDLGLSLPEQKFISRLTVRMALDIGSQVSFYAAYDGEDTWVKLGSVHGTSLRSFTLPVRPRRCDHLRLRIRGVGPAKIYAITKTLQRGSDWT